MADSSALLQARYGLDLPGTAVPPPVAALLDRRVTRRYREQDIPDPLLDTLLAAAQSAPTKSDLQQYAVIVMRDRARIKQIADWIGTMDWIASAPVFLVWCGDMRRGQRLVRAAPEMPHANGNAQHLPQHRGRLHPGDGPVHRRRRRRRPRHLPDQLRAQPHRARNAPAQPPPGVYPVAGLTVGWPVFRRPTAMRLPPAVVVHRERYDDTALETHVQAYDTRRTAREPIAAASLKNNDVYPPHDGVGWSENVARQLSVPERFGFATTT